MEVDLRKILILVFWHFQGNYQVLKHVYDVSFPNMHLEGNIDIDIWKILFFSTGDILSRHLGKAVYHHICTVTTMIGLWKYISES